MHSQRLYQKKIARLIKRIVQLEETETDLRSHIAELEAQLKATESMRIGESVVNTVLLEKISDEDKEWMDAPMGPYKKVDTDKLKAMSKRLTDILGPAFEENNK